MLGIGSSEIDDQHLRVVNYVKQSVVLINTANLLDLFALMGSFPLGAIKYSLRIIYKCISFPNEMLATMWNIRLPARIFCPICAPMRTCMCDINAHSSLTVLIANAYNYYM